MAKKEAFALSNDFSNGAADRINTVKKRILIIEDNYSDLIYTKRILSEVTENIEFDFTEAYMMVDAVKLLISQNFDLVILDLGLPDMCGSATVSAIHSYAPNTPIVVHTGAQYPNMREEAIRFGAEQFMIKGRESPFSFRFMILQALMPHHV